MTDAGPLDGAQRRTHEDDVCIAGGGPTGLTAAIGLAPAKIPFVLLNDGDGPIQESRALVVHAGSMEVLDDLGAADELVVRGRRVETMKAVVRIGMGVLGRVPAVTKGMAREMSCVTRVPWRTGAPPLLAGRADSRRTC